MRLEEVLPALRAGKCIRRSGMGEGHSVFIGIVPPERLPNVWQRSSDKQVGPLLLTHEFGLVDILADDWEVEE